MSMPVQYLAWLWPKMLPIYFHTIAANLYVSLIFFCTNILAIAGIVVVAALYGNTIADTVNTLNARSTAQREAAHQAEQPANKNAAPGDKPAITVPDAPDLKPLIVPGILTFTSMLLFTLTATFNMRGIGQLGYYYKKPLELITEEKEKVYVAKTPGAAAGAFGTLPEVPRKVCSGFLNAGVTLVLAAGAQGYFWYMGYQSTRPVLKWFADYPEAVLVYLAVCAVLTITEAFLLKARVPGAKAIGGFVLAVNLVNPISLGFMAYLASSLFSEEMGKYLQGAPRPKAKSDGDEDEELEEEEEEGH
jgi:hypothetical protein